MFLIDIFIKIHVIHNCIEILMKNFEFFRDIGRLALCEFYTWISSNVFLHGIIRFNFLYADDAFEMD